MSQQRSELGLKNRDGTISRRAVRLDRNTRSKKRAATKRYSYRPKKGVQNPVLELKPREYLRRKLEKLTKN